MRGHHLAITDGVMTEIFLNWPGKFGSETLKNTAGDT
jgi:hypothetical protein